VLNVIRDKGNATIKDIIEVVKDCSEKTIQRELIVLIKDGIIIREGERRWSKYRLV
jgi:DeoR/GlpR family transcriptional regulator of sugar metabolism